AREPLRHPTRCRESTRLRSGHHDGCRRGEPLCRDDLLAEPGGNRDRDTAVHVPRTAAGTPCGSPQRRLLARRRDLRDGHGPTSLHRQDPCRSRFVDPPRLAEAGDRKSTRLNSSHVSISYAVFCLKKKKKNIMLIYLP